MEIHFYFATTRIVDMLRKDILTTYVEFLDMKLIEGE